MHWLGRCSAVRPRRGDKSAQQSLGATAGAADDLAISKVCNTCTIHRASPSPSLAMLKQVRRRWRWYRPVCCRRCEESRRSAFDTVARGGRRRETNALGRISRAREMRHSPSLPAIKLNGSRNSQALFSHLRTVTVPDALNQVHAWKHPSLPGASGIASRPAGVHRLDCPPDLSRSFRTVYQSIAF